MVTCLKSSTNTQVTCKFMSDALEYQKQILEEPNWKSACLYKTVQVKGTNGKTNRYISFRLDDLNKCFE